MQNSLKNLVSAEPVPILAAVDLEPSAAAETQSAAAPILVGTPSGWPMRACYLVGDIVSILIGILSAKFFTAWLASSWWQSFTALELKFFGLFAVGMLIVAAMQRSYSPVPPRPARQFRGWTIGTGLITASLIAMSWMFGLELKHMVTGLVVAAMVTHLTACFLRACCRIKFGKKSWWGTRVLVVGSNSIARDSMHFSIREPQWGIRPVGYVTEDSSIEDLELSVPCLGTIEDLDGIAEQTNVQRAVVALHSLDLQEIRIQFIRPDALIRHWMIIPNFEHRSPLWMDWCEAARMPALSISNRLAKPGAYAMKRALDLIVAGLAALVLLPLLLLIGTLVALTSRGPTFYRHSRVGREGKRFGAWKFRTMQQDADERLARYLADRPDLQEEWQAHQKLKKDPRITPVGRFLRATSLDELPQLWNVLVGDMSLVGPRPIIASEANKYRSLYGHYQQVLPGITGLWQVSGRNDTTYKERVELDVYYIENWSIWLDIYILACTVKVVLLREGAY